MYFDDRKGVFFIGLLFVILNIGFTYWMMKMEYDGLGMFAASFISLGIVIGRLLYVLRNIDYFTFCSQPINQNVPSRKSRSKLFKPGTAVTAIAISAMLLSGCSELTTEANPGEDTQEIVNKASMPDSIDTRLVEDKRLYERDDDSSLKTLYITILPDPEAGKKLDWYSLNRMPKDQQGKDLEIIMQEGLSDGQGPRSGMFGYSATQMNAKITIRGNTAWNTPQKSYRIKLTEDAGTYLDQRTLNLNKHSLDFLVSEIN